MDEKIRLIALWAKQKEIRALQKAREKSGEHYVYWDAKACAFSQVWEFIVFDGKKVGSGISPEEYNKANLEWSKLANET